MSRTGVIRGYRQLEKVAYRDNGSLPIKHNLGAGASLHSDWTPLTVAFTFRSFPHDPLIDIVHTVVVSAVAAASWAS